MGSGANPQKIAFDPGLRQASQIVSVVGTVLFIITQEFSLPNPLPLPTVPAAVAFLDSAWAGCPTCCHIPRDHIQEASGEEMVADIACVVEQAPISPTQPSNLRADLVVFDHLGDTIHLAHHTHRLLRVCFLHHLKHRV